jgi:hypothetical protein
MQKKLVKRKTRPKGMPVWMECTWRRKPCEQDDCPICGRIKEDRQKHLKLGENPDTLKIVLEDVGRNFKEALVIIRANAKRKGIDISSFDNIKEPPEPEKFPLYTEVQKWQKSIFDLAENSRSSFWTYTEDAEDLFWYANTLGLKVYRQLCNKWQVENGAPYEEFDYSYTGYVLNECLNAIKSSLSRLILVGSKDMGKLIFLSAQLMILEKKIARI